MRIAKILLLALAASASLLAAKPGHAQDDTSVTNQCIVFVDFAPAKLPDLIKRCDAAIAAGKHNPFQYMNRGIARAYQQIPEGKQLVDVLSNPGSVSASEARLAIADLEVFLHDDPSTDQADIERANLRIGELTAVLAAQGGDLEGYEKALKRLDAAQVMAKRLELPENYIFEAIARDRMAIYQAFANNYARYDAAYKQVGQPFQQSLKAQQASPTPDYASLCPSLTSMRKAFDELKLAFAHLAGMAERGEIIDPALAARITTRKDQQVQIQASIDATVLRLGCK